MKTHLDRNPSEVHQLDKHGNTLRTFCSKYAAAKWLIDSGYATSTVTIPLAYVYLGGALKNKIDGKLKYGYGFYWKEGNKRQVGQLYNPIPPTNQIIPLVAVHSNGYIEEFKSRAHFIKKYNTNKFRANKIDSGKYINIKNKKIALYSIDNKHVSFKSIRTACEYFHISKEKLKILLKNKHMIRGKIVNIESHSNTQILK